MCALRLGEHDRFQEYRMMELERIDRGNPAFRRRERILQPRNVEKIYQNPMSWITIIRRLKTLT